MPLNDESVPFPIRRVSTLRLSAEAVVGMLTEMQHGSRYFTAKGMPADVRVVGIGLDATSPNTFTVLLESAEFHDVPRGAIAPEIQVTITAHELEALQRPPRELVSAVREEIRKLERVQR